MARVRLLLGVNVFWLALSMLTEGFNSLLLPAMLLGSVPANYQATTLGGLTFVGLAVGMLVQPVAGHLSDQDQGQTGRRRLFSLGTLGLLVCLALFATSRTLLVVFVAYTLLQIAAAVAQAAYQGWLPQLIARAWRGTASGIKGLMDLGGALVAFVVLGELLGQRRFTPALLAMGAVVAGAGILARLLIRELPVAARPSGGDPTRQTPHSIAGSFRLDLRQHRQFAWLVAARFLFLCGTYAVGRFLLFFVADRLRLDPAQAAEQTGGLLAALTLTTALAAPLAGWAADRLGRVPIMVAGAALSAAGTLLLTRADSASTILLFGGLMALGSAAFSSANWAHTADLAPEAEPARFLALANFGTAGAVAAAGLFGPLVDGLNRAAPGAGYVALFVSGAVLAALSGLAASRAQAKTGEATKALEDRSVQPVPGAET
jgi:MFS family permease